uniref:Ribonuclease UK114 (Fragments) n=1 Tax=Gallus gallus TaxID=9031 RepID=UK114_CHICK|nr:RecName: Full=Ribonuclease UK114; AltName: Full=Perchloric acid-soluble protein; Short=PSP [Gallus gallus]
TTVFLADIKSNCPSRVSFQVAALPGARVEIEAIAIQGPI